MVFKKCSLLVLLIILLLAGLSSLYAQTAHSGYFIDPESTVGEPRFIQRLAWSGGDYALYYQVTIERRTENVFVNHLERNTTDLFIEISLSPGEYRFRVIPYDILERPRQPSAWVEFEILPAFIPVLEDISGRADHQSSVIIIHGSNLMPNADITLRSGNNYFTPDFIETLDDGNIEIIFDEHRLPPGEYEVIIRNPGGLEARMGGVNIVYPEPELASQEQPVPVIVPEPSPDTEPAHIAKTELKTQFERGLLIKPRTQREMEIEAEVIAEAEPEIQSEPETEPEIVLTREPESESETDLLVETVETNEIQFIFNFGLIYMPSFSTYGEDIGSNNFFNSLAFYYNILFPAFSFYIGPEFLMANNLSFFDKDSLSLGFNILLRRQFFNNAMAVNLRFGIEYFPAYERSLLGMNAGLSYYWLFNNLIYIEGGLVFSHIFDADYNQYFIGVLRPLLSIGFSY